MEKRYLNVYDGHVGFERVNGELKATHDQKMLDAVVKFAQDFRPHIITLGGDMADCGAISHWKENKQRQVEGVRLLNDLTHLRDEFMVPIAATQPRDGSSKRYHWGNHEQWLEDWVDSNPGLEGIVDLDKLLELSKSKWIVFPQGEASCIGKLYIIHGDQIKGGGVNIAKKAVETYQRNVHFGHFHTHQVYTSITPLDNEPKQGVAVPALCHKNPGYAKGYPNKWLQGFEYGWVQEDGTFFNTVVILVDRKFHAEGKLYKAV